jgi:hypothetical protein
VAGGDDLPILLSLELGKAEAARNLYGISILRSERHSGKERGQDDNGRCGPYAQHRAPLRSLTQSRAGGEANANST